MTDRPYMHGADHRPGGFDPILAGTWHNVAAAATAWSSGTAYSVGNVVSHDVNNYRAIQASTGIEPNVTAGWANYWIIDAPAFQNGWTNAGGGLVAMRYRLLVGPPAASGTSIDDSQSGLEIAGSVMGGALRTVIFTLPDGYRPSGELRLPASDNSGNYVAYRVLANGNVIYGV